LGITHDEYEGFNITMRVIKCDNMIYWNSKLLVARIDQN